MSCDRLEILDLTGFVLFSRKMDSSSAKINIAGIHPGLYLIRCRNERGVIAVKKLVVQ
ncbi:MAG: T9SS type A sorting domain-containing protein [Sphingobacteriales bacterium]|nr:MAG: T9SS type A sorting domain-containing protein [Sphingobacteriales bacterium]